MIIWFPSESIFLEACFKNSIILQWIHQQAFIWKFFLKSLWVFMFVVIRFLLQSSPHLSCERNLCQLCLDDCLRWPFFATESFVKLTAISSLLILIKSSFAVIPDLFNWLNMTLADIYVWTAIFWLTRRKNYQFLKHFRAENYLFFFEVMVQHWVLLSKLLANELISCLQHIPFSQNGASFYLICVDSVIWFIVCWIG